jgi:hypothetical protein
LGRDAHPGNAIRGLDRRDQHLTNNTESQKLRRISLTEFVARTTTPHANEVRTSARPRASTRGSFFGVGSLRFAARSWSPRPGRARASRVWPRMVRRGSTVRVRQRALAKAPQPGLLLSGPLARSTACGGYGAPYGALSSRSVSVRREKRPRCDQGRTQPRPLRSRAAELGLLDVLGRVRGLAKPRMPGFLFGCAVACLTGTGPVGTAGTPRP